MPVARFFQPFSSPGLQEGFLFHRMKERASLLTLPKSMADFAVIARTAACKDPKIVETDDELLPWIFHKPIGLWLSFDGNYSRKSPSEKRESASVARAKREEFERLACQRERDRYYRAAYWSAIRQAVLERDGYECQKCGDKKGDPFQIHHVLKKRLGGTDHFDNLVTVCNKCHSPADNKDYDPDWDRVSPDFKPSQEMQDHFRDQL